jgi:hypothetical protein
MNRSLLPGSLVLCVCALAAGCSSRVYISATGSTPPQFTHVYITTQAIWLNESAGAGASDGGWQRFPLGTPVTIDLVTAANGTLQQIAGDLKLAPGTYQSILLMPLPFSMVADPAARQAGATYNQEVDFVDAGGQPHQVPLQIANPDQGIHIPGSLKVPLGNVGTGLGSGTGTSKTGSTTTSALTATSSHDVTFAIGFNAATDIALFTYGNDGAYGAMFSSHAQAYDLTTVGGISGTVSITTPNNYTNVSARLNITATAEQLAADGSRHVAVLSAPVDADGSFLLYPLPASNDTSNPTQYDVVIHGAGIETMIIKGVQVTRSGSGTSSSSSTATTTVASANTSLGTLVPVAADSYTVGVSDPAAGLPPGAAVGFYQTLQYANEVPYLIDTAAMDPVNHTLALPLPLSLGNLESGSYSTAGTTTTAAATGQTLTLTSAAPLEGAGNYRVAPTAQPGYGQTSLDKIVKAAGAAPAGGSGAQMTVTPPALPLDPSATADTLQLALTVSTSAIRYDAGVLFVTNGGTLIASWPLDTALPQGGTVTVPNIPGGAPGAPYAARYQLSALLWQKADPTKLSLQSFMDGADLSNGSVLDAQATIN